MPVDWLAPLLAEQVLGLHTRQLGSVRSVLRPFDILSENSQYIGSSQGPIGRLPSGHECLGFAQLGLGPSCYIPYAVVS